MKKLLGILLTAVMVCTSMGVLATNNATDDKVVVSVGFEEEMKTDENGKSTIGAFSITKSAGVIEPTTSHKFSDTVTVTPHAGATGTHFLKIGGTGKANTDYLRFTFTAGAQNNPFEWGTCYKISFWYASTRQYGFPNLYFEGGAQEYRANNTLLYPQSKAAVNWRYYEVYFRTKDKPADGTVTPGFGIRLEHDGQAKHYQYYDDFKITKADGAFIGFAKSVTSQTNLQAANYKAIKTVPVTIGTETLNFCPTCVVYTPATDISVKTVKVVSQYIPKTDLTKVTYLVASIYKNDTNGMQILQGLKLLPCTYGKTKYMTSASSLSESGFNGIKVMDLDLTAYGNDCYVKAFMIDDIASLNSASLTATLPAAQ